MGNPEKRNTTEEMPEKALKSRYLRKRYLLFAILALLVLLLIPAERKATPSSPDTAAFGEAKWPAEGEMVERNGFLVLDESHLSQGYFLARVSEPTSKRLKLRVIYADTTLDYDLSGDCEYAVIPLQMGSGAYQVILYENVIGKKYAEVGSLWLYASLEREDAAFFYPNQYVDYSILSMAVSAADAMCEGKNAQESFDLVCDFMGSDFMYDFIKALTVTPGMLPDIDGSFEKKMGVCQDLSAIMCCMLRTRGIPARLIIGYADDSYHAWTITEVNGKERLFDPTAAIYAIPPVGTYSVERFY